MGSTPRRQSADSDEGFPAEVRWMGQTGARWEFRSNGADMPAEPYLIGDLA